jgi:Protein of unknown function (DUF3732)
LDQLGGKTMSLQILQVILYSHDGKLRSISFRPGKLNIITGPPLRGKSQLIEIIDYCLGRGTPNLAPGPITQQVSWYALRLQADATQLFVARRAGHDGARTSEEVFVDRSATIDVPSFSGLRATHNIEGLVSELSEMVGIRQNETAVSESSGREPFKATIRHAILLCLQAQHEIANPSFLFHRQGENNGAVGRDLLATLPYFLGAVSRETISLEADATRVRRELRVAERRLREEELLTQDRRSRADALHAEAMAVGLALPLSVGATYDDILRTLTAVRQWSPRASLHSSVGDVYQQALISRALGSTELRQVRRDIDEASAYAAEQSAFVAELQEQRARLRSVGLYAHLARQDVVVITSDIQQELSEVEREISAAIPPSSDLGQYIEQLETRRASLLAQIQEADQRIEAIADQSDNLRQVRDSDLRQAQVVGRISLFLESIGTSSESGPMSRKAQELRTRLSGLEERIESLEGSTNLSESLGQIGGLMKAWAGELGHEYQKARWRLDEKLGTVVTSGPLGIVPMGTMGGGKNHLGCHLFAHFALHSFFRGNAGAVPGFLFLDRPTIGFYENKPDPNDPAMSKLSQDDQTYVRRLFEWMESLIKGLDGEFQVIVTEHVRLSDSTVFAKAVVEDWWVNDGALVPSDWPERTNSVRA